MTRSTEPSLASPWNNVRPPLAILAVCVVLALVTLAAYWPVTRCEFVYFDDPYYVTENAQVQAGLTWNNLGWALTAHPVGNWHPLTWISHMLDCELCGLDSAGHHLTNVLLHGANGVLLFLLLHRLTGAFWRSALVGALFAWHPLRVESVAWVSERKDVLSTLFWVLTIWAYARYAEFKIQNSKFKIQARTWYRAALVSVRPGVAGQADAGDAAVSAVAAGLLAVAAHAGQRAGFRARHQH